MSVKELLNTVKPLYDESGQRYGVFLSNMEWETLVTFINVDNLNRSEQEMSTEQMADLRGRLKTFAEEWESPEMDIYDKQTMLPTMSGQVQPHVDVTNWASVLELVEDDGPTPTSPNSQT